MWPGTQPHRPYATIAVLMGSNVHRGYRTGPRFSPRPRDEMSSGDQKQPLECYDWNATQRSNETTAAIDKGDQYLSP